MSLAKYHFISGLPRSGSTLLAAILRQNPRFQAGMSSAVGALVNAVLAQMSAGSEVSSLLSQTQRKDVMQGLFDAYYKNELNKEVIFDTNRMWSSKLPLLMDLFPRAKMIACVRNVGWVMDSIERQFRSNPYENSKLFGGNMSRSTVYQRCEGLAQHDQMVGYSWAGLREAFYGEHAKSLLVIDYDLLAQAPEKIMRLLYQFIDEPYFQHDFETLEYDAPDFDLQLGAPGLHRVKPKVEFTERRTVLPPDLFDKYSKLTFWSDPSGSAANVIAPKLNVKENES
ncbi:sulfotransferase family protein [Undibacterium pigrum]|uniref:Sulfotransferase n=1 Tax=Undibacterium pigrum TaxID=401470 RepID=A0A318IL95_9BURK|nr:sulfotransferase [Undibacterium pigrum]PXX36796.1 sulfotransferase [Undibacterium pigrum]